ncbi:MAG: hypothetical protein LBQ37_04790 [Elusimicrobiota bacterium]|jgi:hypothetical protein|nr:hypothetical protein [Elusimicrobiota bacterium]
MNIIRLVFIIIVFYPISAYAYLDPGTGNALLAALFGLIGSLIFFAKSIYYRIRETITGKKEISSKIELAIFSEGKRYWIYFELITQWI